MEMTLQEFMSNTSADITTQVTDMGVSREDTKTYLIVFHDDVEEINGFTYYKWLQCVYVVVSLKNNEILEMQDLDSNEYEQLFQKYI